jgi:hypothetical protein
VFWVEGPTPNALDYVGVVWVIADRRWRSIMEIFVLPPESKEHLRHWNDDCIHCHSTDGVPRPVARDGVWARETSVADFGIACESCHGPGAAHVAARRADSAAERESKGPSKADPTIANPARLSARRSSEVCGLCHGVTHSIDQDRWYREGFVFRPGDELQRSEIVLRPFDPSHAAFIAEREKADPRFVRNQWWSDGDVRISGREYSSMDESPCATKGTLACTSCHSMHAYEAADDQLKAGMRGDAACTQCHVEPKYVAQEHVRHAPKSEGARCQNCHTPNTAYGLLKATRTHRVSSPSVATTLQTGRPNACNLCHLDRPLEWTRERLSEWYGAETVDVPEDRRDVPEGVFGLLSGDAGVRALSAWHFGYGPARAASGAERWAAPFLVEAFEADPYVAPRYQAMKALVALGISGGDRLDDLSSEEERRSAAAAVRAAWSRSRDRSKASALDRSLAGLLREDGTLDPAALARLRALRDDRPIMLAE